MIAAIQKNHVVTCCVFLLDSKILFLYHILDKICLLLTEIVTVTRNLPKNLNRVCKKNDLYVIPSVLHFSAQTGDGDLASHSSLACSHHTTLLLRVVSAQRSEIEDLRSQLRARSRMTNGCYVWRVDDVTRRFTEAQGRRQRGETQLELLSEAFYTSAPTGYKLQGSLFLDGNATGAGQYLSVYVKILCGDYDPLLVWPFTMSVTFTLLNQDSGGQPIESTFSPSGAWWKHLQRNGADLVPSEEAEPIGFGFPKFVSHAILLEPTGRFVRGDRFFLQIKAEPSTAAEEESRSSARYSSI